MLARLMEGCTSMSLGQMVLRLSIAFGLLIAILAGVGLGGLDRMSKMNLAIQNVTDTRWAKVKLAREALHYSTVNNRISMQVFLMPDREQTETVLEQRAQNTEKISRILDQIESQIESDAERESFSRIRAARVPYVSSYLSALDLLVKDNQPERAREVMVTTALPNLLTYHKAYEDFVAFQGACVDEGGNAAEAYYYTARRGVIGLIAFAVVVAAAIAVFVIFRIAGEISNRERAEHDLRTAQEVLEVRVRERTADLEQAQARLTEASRQAGMAEVASGVLHNVGNVLNSVNVAASVIAEKLKSSKVSRLGKAAALLQDHQADLGNFVRSDPHGKQIPAYLTQLSTLLAAENDQMIGEVSLMFKSIDHIKEVIHSQQSLARVGLKPEPVNAPELVDEALRINMVSLERHGVEIVREFKPCPMAYAEKHRVLQILVNLVSNAKKAVMNEGVAQRRIVFSTSPVVIDGKLFISMCVADSGIGIATEDLSRIFQHGFTRSEGGHGFGLHAAAIDAGRMGGKLSVDSPGIGRGATFTLTIPAIERRSEVHT